MNSVAVKKVTEGAYFIVDTTGSFNQISQFDVALASQTILGGPRPAGALTVESEEDRQAEAPSRPDERGPAEHLTREEILERLELGARRRRGMSARELVSQYRQGRLDEPCEVADLLALADLLRDDDELFAAA